ncbi:GerAB/ArcD/ProY family transporter [Bacillus benzoevorans]|uniref:Spore germination protein (Amino acid permease) n=1 Tax=Bacillus benzoevorans TaxID=1456 RepID=A0A7X0HSP5_9BACI|nr:endospore germination permease [Bacillus benzoevorans]MBB6446086.1 spore germination protein (amino acid permease) [Bacillus benzoevorans]
MKKYDSISIVQISLLIITAVGLKNHVTVIPHLLTAAKRDAWLSILFALAVVTLWGLLLMYVHKATQPDNVFDWLGEHFGKAVKWIFVIPTSLVYLVLTAETIKEMVAWTRVTYLPITPSFLTVSLFVLLCVFLVLTSLQTMAIVNTLVLSAILVFGYFVAFANIPQKDFSLLLPFLEHGLDPVYNGMLYPLSGHIEVIALLFLQHKIHNKLSYKAIVINLILLSYLTAGPLIGAIIEFGPLEAARTRFPAYEEWRLVSIGRFIEHVDFLVIYQWISGAYIRVALLLYLSIEVLGIKKQRRKRFVLFFYALAAIAINLIPISDITIHNVIRDYTMPINFWYFLGLSLLLSLFAFIKNRKKRRHAYVQAKENTPVQSE